MREEIENWWKQANADFKTANNSFKSSDYYASAFWCQQSVEKALKALWIKRFNKATPKVHDLKFLAGRLDLPLEFLETCKDLTNIYVETRYPDASGLIPAKQFSKEEVSNFLEEVGQILRWIEKNL